MKHGPLLELINSVLPPLIDLVNFLIDTFLDMLDSIMPVVDILTELISCILDLVMPAVQVLADILTSVLKGAFTDIKNIVSDVKTVFDGFIEFIKGVFTGDWERAWNGIKQIFEGIVSGLGEIFKRPINAMIDLLNGFINGINKIKIPDWVPGLGGMGFSIPNIPRLKRGADFIPSDFYPAYLDYGERVLTKEENAIYNSIGGIEGMQVFKETLQSGNTVEIDYDKLGSAVAKALEGIDVNIDGKKAGEILAPEISNQEYFNFKRSR